MRKEVFGLEENNLQHEEKIQGEPHSFPFA